MRQPGAGFHPFVLVDDGRPHPRIASEIDDAVAPGREHPGEVFHRHGGPGGVVARRLDDHLVGAEAVHPLERPLAAVVERALHPQRRHPVGDHPQPPAWPILRAAIADREDLVAGHQLLALAQRAIGLVDRDHRVEIEVTPAQRLVGGDDHPPAGNGIGAPFRHQRALTSPA
jgi:hypothetical protein